jgi:hypothetical protein
MELDNHLLAVVEPAILPTEIKIDNVGEDGGGAKQTKAIGTLKPFVLVNSYQFGPADIQSFRLDCSGIAPKCEVVVMDNKNAFQVESYPRDGDFFTILLNSKHQETFKSIHMDFDIIEIETSPEVEGGNPTITLEGIAKIPRLYAEDCQTLDADNSLNHLELIARDLELGLATNVESPDDNQARLQAYITYADFIKEIVDDSYISDDAFTKYYIDQYYYLTYVNINKIFNAPNPKLDEVMAVLASFAASMSEGHDQEEDGEENKGDQIEVPLMLTNHKDTNGLSCYVDKYELINNSSKVSLAAGYARNIQIYDNNSDPGDRLQEFKVEALVTEDLPDIEAPLKGNEKDNRYETQVKHKYMGRQNAGEDGLGNTHANAAFSKLHNTQNQMEIEKMKIRMTLSSFNPSIYKFQKIPVIMYHYDGVRAEASKQGDYKRDEAGFTDKPFDAGTAEDANDASQVMDRFISGHYIIENIDYIIEGPDAGIQQIVTLIRREWPTRIKNLEE